MQRRLNKAFDLTPLPLKKLLWSMLFARRWPFSHRGAQLLGSSIYNAAPPSSQTSNAWNTRTSSHKCFFWTLLLFQFPLNRNSGLQCPVGSEIPSGLGLVLASFSSLMIADEGREIVTWSIPEKLLRKSEWFNIIVNKCTTPALRHKLNFCSNFKNSLPNLMNWASYFPPDGFRYWILQPRTCCQVISWHTYVPNWLSVRQNVNLSFMNLDGKKSKSSTKSTEGHAGPFERKMLFETEICKML